MRRREEKSTTILLLSLLVTFVKFDLKGFLRSFQLSLVTFGCFVQHSSVKIANKRSRITARRTSQFR